MRRKSTIKKSTFKKMERATKKIAKAAKKYKKARAKKKKVKRADEARAEAIEAKKAKVRKYIEEHEARGYTYSKELKDFVYAKTPKRVTKGSAYEQEAKVVLNMNRIKSMNEKVNLHLAGATHTQMGNPIIGENKEYDITLNKKSYVKQVNKAIKQASSEVKKTGNDMLTEQIIQFANKHGIYSLKPGEDNEWFTIDKKYDPKKPYTLNQHITFKKFDIDWDNPKDNDDREFLDKVYMNPYVSNEAKEIFNEDVSRRSYATLLNNIMDENDDISKMGWQTAITLESIMNTSMAWNIAKSDALDSDQVKDNWTDLYVAVASIDKKSDYVIDDNKVIRNCYDYVIQMIQNEEDLETILDVVDNRIEQSMKGD